MSEPLFESTVINDVTGRSIGLIIKDNVCQLIAVKPWSEGNTELDYEQADARFSDLGSPAIQFKHGDQCVTIMNLSHAAIKGLGVMFEKRGAEIDKILYDLNIKENESKAD